LSRRSRPINVLERLLEYRNRATNNVIAVIDGLLERRINGAEVTDGEFVILDMMIKNPDIMQLIEWLNSKKDKAFIRGMLEKKKSGMASAITHTYLDEEYGLGDRSHIRKMIEELGVDGLSKLAGVI
jgi:hypothetical protein